jgi:histidine triad (HIT) family protein
MRMSAEGCIFCQIVAGKLPSHIVYQDDSVMAFRDIHPKAPTHILVIPKKHIESLAVLKTDELSIVTHMIETANSIAREQGTSDAYRLVINTGSGAGQAVMHLHMHLLGNRRLSD